MINITSIGDWAKTFTFLRKASKLNLSSLLERYAKKGVEALSQSTPVDTGLAASSWSYEIEQGDTGSKISWINNDIEGGCNVAILIQYGHGVRGGGYVQGRDFINPAMQPIFDEMVIELWKEIGGL